MFSRNCLRPVFVAWTMVLLLGAWQAAAGAIVADHTSCGEYSTIPDSVLGFIHDSYQIYYVHTSHGSQIMSGLALLEAEDARYDYPSFYEVGDDLGHNGDTSWVPGTRSYLDSHPECNMAMFSWCGGCSDNTEAGINIYLNKMDELEAEYPSVTFIYMTGHLDGSGPTGNLYQRNNQIRDFCETNDKILFDFADIESWDPDGNYYPDESDACGWCSDWCAAHACPTCGCAHSHCFNCYQKGKAWWWMMATIADWNQGPCCVGIRGNVDGDGSDLVNIVDVTSLVSYLFDSGAVPPCREEADCDGDGSVNIVDMSALVAYLFSGGDAPAMCP